ncbi:MAG TPA: polysaccharide biosynthesis/export family protein [Pyrinomonadaceae bacterium]|nr:polysaccharide biosynthesis/export family protein [Pyrinomonadaceae bacterium]
MLSGKFFNANLVVFVLAALAILSGNNLTKGQTLTQQEADRYRIGFQDRLSIQVFRHPELNQVVEVNANGTIRLFRIEQPIVAVCKTERELADEIAAAYEKDYLRDAEVNVTVAEQRSQAFAVIGAVEKPAYYVINRRVRLLDLIAYAGGPSKEAGSRVIVSRTGSSSACLKGVEDKDSEDTLMDFRLRDVLEAKQNPEMKPGDIVYVAEADFVYVYGNVIKQGPVKIKEPITLMQAISSAEGVKPASKKDKIRVFRQLPNSNERQELIFDLDKISKREAPDPYLQANDIVAVGEDTTKSIFRSIGKSLTGGFPAIFYRIP